MPKASAVMNIWERGGVFRAGVLALAVFLPLAAPAFADGTTITYAGTLVRGSAPMPQFQLAFPGDNSGNSAASAAATGPAGNLEIDVTSANTNKSVFSFLFSPRPQWGESYDAATGTTSSAAGFNWDDRLWGSRFYGGFGLAGSVLSPGADDPTHRFQGLSPALHGSVHFGYALGGEQDLLLSFDRARSADFSFDTNHGELGDNLRLNYGLRF
jgi:hypothetical protein